MKTLEEIKEIFKNDRFATENGASIEVVEDGYAICSLEITPHHLNAAGAIMGGVPFTLADFAFAVAANAEGLGTVSLSSTINFLNAAKGKKLIAEAKCEKNGRTTCLYSIKVFDELGTSVANVSITGFHKV